MQMESIVPCRAEFMTGNMEYICIFYNFAMQP